MILKAGWLPESPLINFNRKVNIMNQINFVMQTSVLGVKKFKGNIEGTEIDQTKVLVATATAASAIRIRTKQPCGRYYTGNTGGNLFRPRRKCQPDPGNVCAHLGRKTRIQTAV